VFIYLLHLFIFHLCVDRVSACLLGIQTIRLLEVVDGHVDTHVLLARNQHQRVRLRHDRVLTGGGREREGGGEREGGREEGGNDGGKHFHSEGGTARDQASANPACVPPCCLLHVSSSAERESERERGTRN